MEGLEALYQLETGAAFGELGSLSGNKEFKLYRLPWEEWAGKFKYAAGGLLGLLRCFNKAFIEPNKDSSIFCNLMLRGKFEDLSSISTFGKNPNCGCLIIRMRTGTSRDSANTFSSTWRLIYRFI